ncbi:hypothetical protein GCM10027592_31700 [Spirosoma flavus]
MVKLDNLRTIEQYNHLSEKQLLRLVYAALLLLIQLGYQILASVMANLELSTTKQSPEVKQKLANTELDPEPLAAIQRRIEETQQELEEDLQSGVYNAGV